MASSDNFVDHMVDCISFSLDNKVKFFHAYFLLAIFLFTSISFDKLLVSRVTLSRLCGRKLIGMSSTMTMMMPVSICILVL